MPPRPALARLDDPPAENATQADREAVLSEGCMSVKAAEKFLGVSDSLIYVWLDTGVLPSVRFGRRRLIPRKAVIAWAATNMTDPQAQ